MKDLVWLNFKYVQTITQQNKYYLRENILQSHTKFHTNYMNSTQCNYYPL